MENKIVIEIGEDKLAKIKVQTEGGIETKYVSVNDIAEMFTGAKEMDTSESEVYMESPILPQFNGISTTQYLESESTQIYILRKEKCQMNLSYFGDTFTNVGIPTLLFKIIISKNSIKGIEVVAIKDPVITGTTVLFKYPFSNVFSSTRMCLGANNIAALEIAETATIYRIPNLVLSLDNNNDAYRGSNSSNLELRQLFEALSERDFDEQLLIKLPLTYEKWVSDNKK